MKIDVWQIDIKVILLKDIEFSKVLTKVTYFIDSIVVKKEEWAKYHNSKSLKSYCFNSLYPIEKTGIYKKGREYTIRIRTISKDFKDYLCNQLDNNVTRDMQTKKITCQKLKYRFLKKLHSVTPVVIKLPSGYWRNSITEEEFLNLLKENSIKKYELFTNRKLDYNIDLFEGIEFFNKVPVSTKYKNIKILGDKVAISVSKDVLSQEIAFFCLGVGIGNMSARGFSYVNPRW